MWELHPPSWAFHASAGSRVLPIVFCKRLSFQRLDISFRGLVFSPLLISLSPPTLVSGPPDASQLLCRGCTCAGEHSLREIIDFGSASYEIWEENK